ncbi:MAG TPA: DUF1629 domain-containing protein [Allosphingosinicella sp.]|jgi:hypothetical protein
MVCYLARSGDGIERYAETEWDLLDMPVATMSRQAEYADPDQVHPSALGENVSRLEQGYWVKPESLPKKVLWANGTKPIPDVLPRFVVSPRFRDLVEQFEPGVHQFVPVEIYKSRDGESAAIYYWFIIGQRVCSVDEEHTTYIFKAFSDQPEDGYWSKRKRNRELQRYEDIPGAQLFFSNSRTDGHHIWKDPQLLTGGERLCSDSFADAVTAGNYTGVNVSKRATV